MHTTSRRDCEDQGTSRKQRVPFVKSCRAFNAETATVDQLNLNNLLSHIHDTVLKNDTDKSGIGFIADNISPILRYLFPLKDSISYKWDKFSFKINTANVDQKLRLDFVLYANSQEIGCGEVKVPNTQSTLLDIDRVRIGETLKGQLHVRIMKCKEQEQMVTFGVFCEDHGIELNVMSFDKEAEQPYHYTISRLSHSLAH